MKWIKKIFRRRQREQQPPQSLRIEGIGDAPLTPEPDDAELAAQAVLELIMERPTPNPSLLERGVNTFKRNKESAADITTHSHSGEGRGEVSSAYYHQLADRIRKAHETARLRTMRFLAYCEQTLAQPDIPMTGPNSLQLIEAELLKRIDIVEREGGELKRRWQHCLADVTVRLMKLSDEDV